MRGDNLRDQVSQIIKARYGNAAVEHKLAGKDADVFFRMKYPGGEPLGIAIECKEWKNPLQSEQINRIFSSYAPAFNTGEIDSLWIVATKPIRAEQAETIASYGMKLRFFTVQSLYNDILDFTQYLSNLVADFEKDGLSEYYIMPRTSDGKVLHADVIEPWLKRDSTNPLAVVAGYGAGKTSYAKFLARDLAKKALAGTGFLKPILMQLGSLTSHQTIRGLLSSLFVDEFNIDGYNYSTFRILLEHGEFLLIFDGFDEMKHAMKRRDIAANFNDIIEFIKGTKSKLILFGRPDPFISIDDELPLRGYIKIGTQLLRDETRPEFRITSLDDFSTSELDLFLNRFISHAILGSDILDKRSYVKRRIREIHGANIVDVVKRPVHARMLGTLAASPKWNIAASSEYDLYSHFVTEFARREVTEKIARAPVPEPDRILFMAQIAWWLWTKHKNISFTADEVPPALINDCRKYFDDNVDLEVMLRELLIGSMFSRTMTTDLIVEKRAFCYYFPHRSYWEFLVAEYIASPNFSALAFSELLQGVTPQVIKFLSERNDRSFVQRLVQVLNKYEGAIDLDFLTTFATVLKGDEWDLLLSPATFRSALLLCAGASSGALPFERLERAVQLMPVKDRVRARNLALYFANLYCALARKPSLAGRKYCEKLNCEFLIEIVDIIGFDELVRVKMTDQRIAVSARLSHEMFSFFRNCTYIANKEKGSYICFAVEEIAQCLDSVLPDTEHIEIAYEKIVGIDIEISLEEFVSQYGNQANGYRVIFHNSMPRIVSDIFRHDDT